MSELTEISLSFRAMNTDVVVILTLLQTQVSEGLTRLEVIRDIFLHCEKVLSRFRGDSELSALNLCAGKPFKASPLLFKVVKAALTSARMTRGFFDPTLLPFLKAAGYEGSFETLTGTMGENSVYGSLLKSNWQDVRMMPARRCIVLPPGCQIDLGGIGKGWTVDRVSRGLEEYPGFVIDAGGDIRLSGIQSNGLPWSVGVADPFEPEEDLMRFALRRGAICTSTTARRRWFSQGNWQHHLIDSRTGKPSTSEVVSATVISGTAAHAEVLAKAALLMRAERGLNFLQKQAQVSGLLVLDNGQYLRSAGFAGALNVA